MCHIETPVFFPIWVRSTTFPFSLPFELNLQETSTTKGIKEKKRIETMSSNVPISGPGITAPTPQNTPLNQGPIALGLSRPTVPAISEDGEEGASDEPAENITTDGALSGIEQHMLGMVQGKLAGLVGKSSGYIESLPVDIKLNVEALKGVQVKQNELQNKYKRECLELEKKVCFIAFFSLFSFFFSFFGSQICCFVERHFICILLSTRTHRSSCRRSQGCLRLAFTEIYVLSRHRGTSVD